MITARPHQESVTPTLIFLHIQKTGGTTLRRIIERQFRRQAILRVYGRNATRADPEGLMVLPMDQRRRIALVEGHIRFGWHRVVAQPAQYITMLREPVDRTISEYYHALGDPRLRADLSLHPAESILSGIRRYLEGGKEKYSANRQTKMIAGWSPSCPSVSDSDLLHAAKENLETHFKWVGLTEEFDESLMLLSHAFKWRWLYYTRSNVNRIRLRREDLPPQVVNFIRDKNQLDVKVYHYAQTKLHEGIGRQSATFRQSLAQFRRRNKAYGRFMVRVLDSELALRERLTRMMHPS